MAAFGPRICEGRNLSSDDESYVRRLERVFQAIDHSGTQGWRYVVFRCTREGAAALSCTVRAPDIRSSFLGSRRSLHLLFPGPMPLPKFAAAAVCTLILGAQIYSASPLSPDRFGWYWPFLPYPMYAKSHALSDTMVVTQLRAAACVRADAQRVLGPDALGTPLSEYSSTLGTIARAPASDTARHVEERLSRVIEAQYPGHYCSASAWARTIRVADPATYGLDARMHRVATWQVNGASSP
jgi:hypothetical protein